MSKSLRVQVKLFTKENLHRFGLLLLGTEVNHNKMMSQKIELKRFGSLGFFEPAPSFHRFLSGVESAQQRGLGSNILTDKQRAVLESLGTATRISGYKADVKSLPSASEAIPVEFYIPSREREKVPVRPIRSSGGKYET
ncbi:MAG: hypothetical protein NTY64_21500 [Deltaproteobacteria bacterium]|nr:hypothetical protein [Deltaproteobacteria bacterium]